MRFLSGMLLRAFPTAWANHLRCLKHNRLERNPFSIHWRGGVFRVDYPAFSIRFHDNPFSDLALEGPGYFLRRTIQPGDTVVDAGAYVGALTVFMAVQAGSEGRVIAFEPDPGNASRLRANLALNHLENVTVVEKALWNAEGTAHWGNPGTPMARASIEPDATDSLHVGLTTLDRALHELGVERIDFLKADVEGAELRLLEGAEQTLSHSDVHVAIASYHRDESGITAPRVEECLRTLGYQCETGNPRHLTTWGWK